MQYIPFSINTCLEVALNPEEILRFSFNYAHAALFITLFMFSSATFEISDHLFPRLKDI